MTAPHARLSSADSSDPGRTTSWRNNRYMDGKYDRGWDMSVELIAAMLVWGGVGWLIDRWLGTAPWAMVIGILIGNAAGVYLVIVRARADEQQRAERQPQTVRAASGPGIQPASHQPDGRQ